MTVWLLITWIGGMAHGTITVSGIASENECHRLAAQIVKLKGTTPHHCIPYEWLTKEDRIVTIERCITELGRMHQPQLDEHDDYARGINDALTQAADALRTLKEQP